MRKLSLLLFIALSAITPGHAQLLHLGYYSGTNFNHDAPVRAWDNDLFARYEAWDGPAIECSIGLVKDARHLGDTYSGYDNTTNYNYNWHLKSNLVQFQILCQYHVFASSYERLRCYAGFSATFFYNSYHESYTQVSNTNPGDVKNAASSGKSLSGYIGGGVRAEYDISKHFMIDLLTNINLLGRPLYATSAGTPYLVSVYSVAPGPAFLTCRLGINYNIFLSRDPEEQKE